jgi:signal transduction histidine kinase/DNA-binding LacI/PurR family transcriptional regulator/ActR/RegA family two-component response regulator
MVGMTTTIGALTSSIVDLHELQWLGMVDGARECDVDLVCFAGAELGHPEAFRAQANAVFDLVSSERLDGLVVWTTTLGLYVGTDALRQFCARFEPLPMVSVEQILPGSPSVLMDERQGMHDAVSHLIEAHGHLSIAFIRGPENHAGAHDRFQGYLDALTEHRLPFDSSLAPQVSHWSPEEAGAAATKLLAARPGGVDAFATANDDLALGVVIALEALGREVPSDVAVVGFDDHTDIMDHVLGMETHDSDMAGAVVVRSLTLNTATLPLTTVQAPFHELGRRAVELLLDQISGRPVPDVITVPTRLVVRRSCGCLSSPARRPAPPDWANRLETTVAAAIRVGSPDAILSALDLAKRVGEFQHLVDRKLERILRKVGRRLIVAADAAQLVATLSEDLPKLEIPSCYLAAYAEESGGAGPTSRALLVHESGSTTKLPSAGLAFPSQRLAPVDHLGSATPASLIALPLYFKDQQLGFVLFEFGPRAGWIYRTLQEQLGSALHTVLLLERERSALAAVARAQHELEDRVAARTAELAKANEVLTEQIRERERAEATQAKLEWQLRQAQKMEAIGRLAGGIAHDFNNMLVVINGYSELMLRGLGPEDAMREELLQIQLAGQRAADLTRGLLSFSRQQVVRPAVLSLNDVVEALEPMLRRLMGEDVELLVHLDPALAPVRADRSQLDQVLLNLVVNARDAMATGDTLTIESSDVMLDESQVQDQVDVAAGAYVRLRVTDTGVGMDAATRARLFEPFFTTKPAGRGTGLGLSIVFGIVQQSGGHIAVSSQPDHGTSVDIYLPQSAEALLGAADAAVTPAMLTGSETILLVEDEPGVRQASRLFLQEYGYHVLEAADAADAMRLCQRHDVPVDLVLTDVVMPGMSGAELAERVAEMRPRTPVLYMSGYLDSKLAGTGIQDGPYPVLEKPFGAEALARRVRETLDSVG